MALDDMTKFERWAFDKVRTIGGQYWSIAGVHPAGRSEHRKKRIDVIHELIDFTKVSQEVLDGDMYARSVVNLGRQADAIHHIAEAKGTGNEIAMKGLIAQYIDKGYSRERVSSELGLSIDDVPGVSPLAHAPEVNLTPDTEWCWRMADIRALHIRLSGAMRHGQPWEEDAIDAATDFFESLRTSIGSHSPDASRFHTRRADMHRDVMLDLAALRWLDRVQVNPDFTLRQAMTSVFSDHYAHTMQKYQEWEDAVNGPKAEVAVLNEEYRNKVVEALRGAVDERDGLYHKYDVGISDVFAQVKKNIRQRSNLQEEHDRYGPGSALPVYRQKDITIPDGRAWEVVAKIYSDLQYDGPGGPNWGANMQEQWEKKGGPFGLNPNPTEAQMTVLIHGRKAGQYRAMAGTPSPRQLSGKKTITVMAEPVEDQPAPAPRGGATLVPGTGVMLEEPDPVPARRPRPPAPAGKASAQPPVEVDPATSPSRRPGQKRDLSKYAPSPDAEQYGKWQDDVNNNPRGGRRK